MRGRWFEALPLLILALALFTLFGGLFLQDRFLFWGLPSLQFHPWRSLAFEELSAGRLPFLNPYNGGGAPLIANYQSAVFYPPNWLHLLLDDARAIGVLAVLHVFWGGLGMWLFLGSLDAGSFGRGVSALAYALMGYTMGRLGSLPTQNAVAWLPWLFWAVHGLLETRRAQQLGILGLITGMLLLVGHAQTAWYGLLGAGGYALWKSGFDLPSFSRQQRLHALLLSGAGVLLGVGVASIQLVFTAELLRVSQRAEGLDYSALTNLSFAPLRLLLFLLPNFLGNPGDGSYLLPGKGIFFEDAVYIGIIPLLAAIAAVAGWFRQRRFLQLTRAFRSVPYWVLMALVGFVFALGHFSPVLEFFYHYVPTFDAFREPVRWMIIPSFALCVLAGIGVQHWGRSPRVFFWTRLAVAAGAGTVLMTLLVQQFSQGQEATITVMGRALVAFGCWMLSAAVLTLAQPDETAPSTSQRLWQLAVLCVVAADLVWAAQGLNPTVPGTFYRDGTFSIPRGRLYWTEDYEESVKFDSYFDLSDYRLATRHAPALRNSLLPNLNILDEVALFNNFEPLQPEGWLRYQALIEAKGDDAAALLAAAGVGQVYGEIQPEGWAVIEGENPSAIARETPARVWVVPEARWVDGPAEAEALLLEAELDDLMQNYVVLQGSSSDSPDPTLTTLSFFETVQDSPQYKHYRLVSDGAGYLVLAYAWYPGWEAEIDGQATPLYRANLAFMAVPLPPEGGEVILRYRPLIGVPGLLVSFVSLCVVLALIAFGLIRQEPDFG